MTLFFGVFSCTVMETLDEGGPLSFQVINDKKPTIDETISAPTLYEKTVREQKHKW